MAPSILRSYDFPTFFFLIPQLFSEFLHIERKLHKESLDIYETLQNFRKEPLVKNAIAL